MLVVSKFKLREKERQHSHGNFGRMLGGFYNFFFKASRPDVRYTMYAVLLCSALVVLH